VLTSIAALGAIAHPGGFPGFGLFFLIPLFWILVLVAVFAIAGRRWRSRAAMGGYGPWGHPGAAAARSAQATLAERFANGDIDEKEYRARLEVLRANAPVPPTR
jgi:putative membrane protein